ncbi:MAG TPA: transposase [Oligoflexus sp.]|uniref:transposase n=1 Tax=Oligoflexus sp. TaxID=1971216 RepID=UPI002D672008|nr:transposase [Oligoflexus sp.]HYX35152.1 transposase [Oligoflexus sp.]
MFDKKARKQYSKEFKAEAIKLVTDQGMKASDAAKDLGISVPTLSSWLFKAKQSRKGQNRCKGHPDELERKVRELEQQVKRLTMEREILKKAMGYFAELPK